MCGALREVFSISVLVESQRRILMSRKTLSNSHLASNKVYQIPRINSRYNSQQRYACNQELIRRGGDKDLTLAVALVPGLSLHSPHGTARVYSYR